MTTSLTPTRTTRRPGTYLRYELLRTARNVRFTIFAVAFPLVLFLLIAGPNRNEELAGIPFPTYYMAGMIAWGGMAAVLSSGARIAAERSAGWNRQLRLTPLSASRYFAAKTVAGYAVAAVAIAVLAAAGTAFGVRLAATGWMTMIGLVLIGLLPFAALGVALGHVLTPESMGPALGGTSALFALLGGAWGPLGNGFIDGIGQALPSYWVVQAGHAGVTGDVWPLRGWLVVAVWTAVMTWLAVEAYRRDTRRV